MITRRRLLTGGAATATLLAASPVPFASAARARPPRDVFTLGVASGDPLPHSVVLWTRLAPDPLHGGGMPPRRFPVEWEIAEDERFRRVVERGIELATPDLGHSVHAEPRGLRPAASYFYRFRVDGQISPVGRTRTAPAQRSSPGRLRLAFASCQDFEAGFYAAYRGMAAEDLDLVVHLGDYIYEGGPQLQVRQHDGPEVDGLDSFRHDRLRSGCRAAHGRIYPSSDSERAEEADAGSHPRGGGSAVRGDDERVADMLEAAEKLEEQGSKGRVIVNLPSG